MMAAATRIPFLLLALAEASCDESSAENAGPEAAGVSVSAAAAARIAGFAGATSGTFVGAITIATACSASHAVVGIVGFGASFAGAGALAAPPDVRTEDANAGRASFIGVVAATDGSLGAGTASFFSSAAAGLCREVPAAFKTDCQGYCWELVG
jgi:hypothetical protein